jgi:Rrf2 family cysteine metabolism transcriptional repressor
MRLTARSEYGLLALIDISCRDGAGPVSVRGIAERQAIPAKFLEQLFVSLRKAGLVTGIRGAHGGFELARSAADITVLDVVEALEGPLQPSQCAAEESCHRSGACAAGAVWARATEALRGVLTGTTLAELARAQHGIDATGAALSLGGATEHG